MGRICEEMMDSVADVSEEVLFQNPDTPVVRDTLLGKRKRLTGLGPWEWAFFLVSLTNIVACIVLSAYRLHNVVTGGDDSPDFTLTILLIINSSFCLFYVIHGLLKELRYEIYVLILATLVVFLYCIIEYIVNSGNRTGVKTARLIVACVMAPVNVSLAVKVAYDFGWLEFRILGASQCMLWMYRQACWFLSLIKFDLQLAVSFLVLVLKNGKFENRLEISLVLSIGLTVSLLWCITGAFLVKHESKISAWFFALIGFAAPVYVFFKVVKAYMKYNHPDHHKDEEMLLYSTIFIGALFIVIRILVYIELVHVYREFGKGLRTRAFDDVANERSGLLAR